MKLRTRTCRIAGVLLLSFFAYVANDAKSFAADLLATKKSTVTLSPNMILPISKIPTQSFTAASLIEAQKLLPSITMYDSIYNLNIGVSNASSDLTTGEVWAVTINNGRQYNYISNWTGTNITVSSSSFFLAGFSTKGIKNTGTTPWRGVTVTSTIQVISLLSPGGPSGVMFEVFGDSFSYGDRIRGWVPVDAKGQFTVTTPPFDIAPGATFSATAVIFAVPPPMFGVSVYAKITSIKINL